MTIRPFFALAATIVVSGLPSIAPALSWVGNTRVLQGSSALPFRGAFVEPGMAVTLTTETYPIESGQRVVAVVSTDGFLTSRETIFTHDGNVGNNSRWYALIGPQPSNTRLDFYLRAEGNGGPRYDNNSSANFGVFVRPAPPTRRGAILQWFETDYNEILRRLPEIIDAGYTALYLPSPVKSGGGTFSVGYNPFDRFDLGDRPQKGSTRTKYGTAQELKILIDTAHRLGLEVYADLVLNHNDNRASSGISNYPDLIPEDFHIRSSADTGNNEVNFNTESAFTFGMLNHDLLGLTDLAPEDGNLVRTGTFTFPAYATWSPSGKPQYIRHPLTPAYYPAGITVTEDVGSYLKRWTTWLATTIGFDGFRLDAVKHMAPPALGWAPDQPTGGAGFGSGNLLNDVAFAAPGRFIFGEVYSSNAYELREFAKTGQNLLDFPLKFLMGDVFNGNGFGDLRRLANDYGRDGSTGLPYQQGGLAAELSVGFAQSHDDGPPESNHLAYAFTMTRGGRGKVYYDGNRIAPNDWAHFPRPGRSDAVARGGIIARLADAVNRFGRGIVTNRWVADRLYIYERTLNGAGLLLVGLNNRSDAGQQTADVATAFLAGTVLEDLSGQMPDLTVRSDGRVTVTVPNNFSATNPDNGTGFVVYAPLTPRALAGQPALRLLNPASRSAQLARQTVMLPAGAYGTPQSYEAWRVMADRVDLEVWVDGNPSAVLVRLDEGLPMAGRAPLSNTPEGLTDGYVALARQRDGSWRLAGVDLGLLPNGLHLLRTRAFLPTGARPGLFREFTSYLHVQRNASGAVDGRLEEYGAPLATQPRSASSSSNRLDAVYVTNDDQYLYVGVAGRVDASASFTNGLAVFLDTTTGGVSDLGSVADDSGPAARLATNARVRFPAGFEADWTLASVQGGILSSASELGFPGSPRPTPTIGAQAGAFALDPTRPLQMHPGAVAVAYVPRTSLAETPRGWEFAIALRQLYASGVPVDARLRLLALLGTTGESSTTLQASDVRRGTLGGRPAPNPWLTNQFLPAQSSVGSDPGRNSVVATATTAFLLRQASVVPPGSARIVIGNLLLSGRRGPATQTVTVENIGTAPWAGPVRLRVTLPAGWQAGANLRPGLRTANTAYLTLSAGSMAPGRGITVGVEFSALGAGTPNYEVVSGAGLL